MSKNSVIPKDCWINSTHVVDSGNGRASFTSFVAILITVGLESVTYVNILCFILPFMTNTAPSFRPHFKNILIVLFLSLLPSLESNPSVKFIRRTIFWSPLAAMPSFISLYNFPRPMVNWLKIPRFPYYCFVALHRRFFYANFWTPHLRQSFPALVILYTVMGSNLFPIFFQMRYVLSGFLPIEPQITLLTE